jgi:hypothetical protein
MLMNGARSMQADDGQATRTDGAEAMQPDGAGTTQTDGAGATQPNGAGTTQPNGDQATQANPHLNVFEPYRDLSRGHEDQLTRAAMIVLRMVPLARETLLAAIGEGSQSRLPECVLDMQATHIVEPPAGDRDNTAPVRRGRLVSVFLTPDIEPFDLAEEITDTDRGQRFDGVLRFDPELVVVVESKVCRRWARRDGHRVAQLNLRGARFEQRRTCLLPWHDLLEGWLRLVELDALGPAERALVQDMLDYAHRDFAHLLPFGSLRRAGSDPTRRARRLRSLLAQATGVTPERASLVHVRLDVALGVVAFQRAALRIDGEDLVLHLWPGELKHQAERLYGDSRAERLSALDRPGEPWRVRPQPVLGYRNAPIRSRVYLTCTLDAVAYARRWQGADWERVGAHHRNHILDALWPWLLARGYASPQDLAPLRAFVESLGRRFAHLRPGMHVTRAWPLEQAEELDDAGALAGEIRAALQQVLGILEEPGLPPAPS